MNNPSLSSVPKESIPSCESLKDLIARTVPYYEATIVPEIKAGKRILVAAHGTSLRGIVKVCRIKKSKDLLKGRL